LESVLGDCGSGCGAVSQQDTIVSVADVSQRGRMRPDTPGRSGALRFESSQSLEYHAAFRPASMAAQSTPRRRDGSVPLGDGRIAAPALLCWCRRAVRELRDDLSSGRWAVRNRHLVALDAAELGLRLLVA
jgi:hypothetical protein